jgi:hypothetical protein
MKAPSDRAEHHDCKPMLEAKGSTHFQSRRGNEGGKVLAEDQTSTYLFRMSLRLHRPYRSKRRLSQHDPNKALPFNIPLSLQYFSQAKAKQALIFLGNSVIT